jgi:hypothetical protein
MSKGRIDFPRSAWTRLLGLGLVIATVAGCAAAGAGASAAAGPASGAADDRGDRGDRGDRALAALQALVGDAACRDDTQCRTLPVGTLACGGPASYLAWSTLRSNETALKAAAAPLAHRRPGSARGEMSICRVLPDPGARCVQAQGGSLGTCRLREGSNGAGGALPTR